MVAFDRVIARVVTCAALLSSCLLIGACASSQLGPYRPITIEDDVALIKPIAEPDLTNFYSLSPAAQAAARNDIITARMYIADLEYSKYEARLTREMQQEGLAATVASLGLTTSATLIPVAQTDKILSGIATGVTGLDKAYTDKELLSNTMQALQTQMRADRKTEAAEIYSKMFADKNNQIITSISQYTLAMALSDTDRYYQAGTIASALIGLTKTVTNADTNAQNAKDSAGPNAPKVTLAKSTAAPLPSTSIPLQTAVIRNVNAALPEQSPFRSNSSDRETPFEQSLTIPSIKQIQTAMCVNPDGVLGPTTRQAIGDYLVARGQARSSTITPRIGDFLADAVDKVAAHGGCSALGFKSAADVGKSFNQ